MEVSGLAENKLSCSLTMSWTTKNINAVAGVGTGRLHFLVVQNMSLPKSTK